MMNNNIVFLLSATIFLNGCETASDQGSEIIGSVSASGSAQVNMSNNDSDTTSYSTISSISSETPGLNAQEILEQKFLKIGTTVYFDFDKSTLNSDALAVLIEQAGFLKNYPYTKIIIEGHCDERGTREYNLALGDRRAAAARDFLVANGIDDKRINLISYGKEKPFKDNLLIDEIISMTYPQVADFFKNHVEGKVPINYMEYLKWDTPSGMAEMALGKGHQAIQSQAIGITKWDKNEKRVKIVDIEYFNARCVNPPENISAIDWIKGGFEGAKC